MTVRRTGRDGPARRPDCGPHTTLGPTRIAPIHAARCNGAVSAVESHAYGSPHALARVGGGKRRVKRFFATGLVLWHEWTRFRLAHATRRPARRHGKSRVHATSHHTSPGKWGGAAPAVKAATQPTDEPGNRRANTSGYRASNSRFLRVARTTQQDATRYGRSPPMEIATISASATFRAVERAPAPMSPMTFQHSISSSTRCASSRSPTSVDAAADRVGSSKVARMPARRASRRTSSWIWRCPASAGSSSGSRLTSVTSERSRAAKARCQTSIERELPRPRSIRLIVDCETPIAAPRCAWVARRRFREARSCPPRRASCSRLRRAASASSSGRFSLDISRPLLLRALGWPLSGALPSLIGPCGSWHEWGRWQVSYGSRFDALSGPAALRARMVTIRRATGAEYLGRRRLRGGRHRRWCIIASWMRSRCGSSSPRTRR
jgi:hypothetical protein